jgi:hypothetical protein
MLKSANVQLNHPEFSFPFQMLHGNLPAFTPTYFPQMQINVYHTFRRIAYWQKPKNMGLWVCLKILDPLAYRDIFPIK